jgi:acyl dehydratase
MLNYQAVKAWPFVDVAQSYTRRDTMLYALGIGIGYDPVDAGQLRYVYERDLRAVPTMAAVLGAQAGWLRDPRSGADYVKLVHGEQRVHVLQPLRAEDSIVGRDRVESITDKGAGKGAVVVTKRDIRRASDHSLVATSTAVLVLRGDGGFSAETGVSDPAPAPLPRVPDRKADIEVTLPTLPQAALIYRLSGDYNPLHADPAVAGAAGFPRAILHGLCSFGVAAHAVLKACCDYDSSRIRSVAMRFAAPVYPGESLRFELWRDGPARVQLRALIDSRSVEVLSNGLVELAG